LAQGKKKPGVRIFRFRFGKLVMFLMASLAWTWRGVGETAVCMISILKISSEWAG